jgi:hypothetical protein
MKMKMKIVKEADRVPFCLFPFLEREFVISNGHLTMHVVGKCVEVHPDFRLILVTRNSAITLTPREVSLVAVVNFTMTRAALRMQLLTQILSIVMAELEQQHQK